MRAAIYARYSSDRQREESITAQFRAAEEYCHRKGYIVVKHYKDEAKTGKNDRRPDFQQMVKDAERGIFDRLIVHKVDRFARTQYDGVVYKYKLNKCGVLIEYVEQNINPEDKNSKMIEGIYLAMAEQFSDNLANETMKGLKENAHNHKFNGGYAPLGYKIIEGRYVIDDFEAQAVKAIFEMHLQGKGYKDILGFLQNSGYKTRKGSDFGKNSLHAILSNEKYMGIYTFNKVKRREDGSRNSHRKSNEILSFPDAIPAIITKDQFAAVQERMSKNKRRPGAFLAKREYLLSGLIVCGECGAAVQCKASTVRGKDYYRCYCGSRERKVGQCSNPTIRLFDLEDFVVEQISQRLLSPAVLPELVENITQAHAAKKSTITGELTALVKQRAGLVSKIDNLLNFIENGNVNDHVKARLAENEKNLAIMEARIHTTRAYMNRQILDKKQVATLFSSYQALLNKKDPDSLRVLLNTFLERVTVHRDHVDVALKISVGVLGAREGT